VLATLINPAGLAVFELITPVYCVLLVYVWIPDPASVSVTSIWMYREWALQQAIAVHPDRCTLTLAGSGIQTYTNNTQYTGVISSNTASPAGLINVANTAAAPLPTAWQIVAGNSPVAPDDPNCTGVSTATICSGHTQTGYAWFFHEDKSQVANNQGVTGPFVNAAPYIEMETAGIHRRSSSHRVLSGIRRATRTTSILKRTSTTP